MRTVERAARVGVGAWNDSGVTVARESAMVDLERATKEFNYRRFAPCWRALACKKNGIGRLLEGAVA